MRVWHFIPKPFEIRTVKPAHAQAIEMSDVPKKKFEATYYDSEYFTGEKGGKSYKAADGTLHKWSYFNPSGEWTGCRHIVAAWKEMFTPKNLLDVGCGRGQIISYARDIGIAAEGFDFSEWATGDEGRYEGTKAEWVKCHDATEKWPYPDNSFDLVVSLDLLEHIYVEDIDFVLSEICRVARKWVFLQIAVSETGGLQGRSEAGYNLEKNNAVPIGLEGCAVAGHVTVMSESFWIDKIDLEDLFLRRDLKEYFVSLVSPDVIKNWLLNSILIYEKLED